MTKKEKIFKLLKENNVDDIFKFNKNSTGNLLLEILDDEITNFDYEKDIEHLKTLINILPKFQINNSKLFYEKLENIHQKIKIFLVQKPGNIEKNNTNYKILKNVINNIELIEVSLLFEYTSKYEESKYELIKYIIFDVKNISFIKDAVKRFPNIVNYIDENDKVLIVSVIEKYIDEVIEYTKDKGIDSIIYYDDVIEVLFESPKLIFDVVDKQNLLKLIKIKLNEITDEKDRKVFYLNHLVDRINYKNEKTTNSYLEYKYNIKTYFNEAIKSEEESLINNYNLSKERTLINDFIITVDGVDAKEIDDALSIKMLENGNYLLGVHIADPLSIIDNNNILFDEASKRTTSIYLSDQTYYLFPEKLSCNLLSLEENEYRNARSYYFEIDKLGNLIDKKFLKTIIKVDKNMTYDEFNNVLTNKSKDKILNETIKNLSNVSLLLQMYYSEDELYSKINRTNNNLTKTNITGLSNSEKVVESSMVFTNYMVAKYFKENNLPFIYRNHIIDDKMLRKLDKIKKNLSIETDSLEYIKYIDIIENIYPKAVYDIKCSGHFGLGIECYSHVTSPLRRFADVVALTCLDKLYFDEYSEEDIKNIEKLVKKHCFIINNKRDSIEKFSLKYEYVKRH